ncbi:unnamed protein product, partial [Effrenium voratum]
MKTQIDRSTDPEVAEKRPGHLAGAEPPDSQEAGKVFSTPSFEPRAGSPLKESVGQGGDFFGLIRLFGCAPERCAPRTSCGCAWNEDLPAGPEAPQRFGFGGSSEEPINFQVQPPVS